MGSRIRQNYCPDCERAINRLINQEYYTSYVYLAMSFFFERDDVALKHFARFFHGMSEAERRAAEELIDYQKRRGGRMYLQSVEKPAQSEWQNGLEALQCALQLQKSLNQSLQELHHLAADRNDPQLCDFLASRFLSHCVQTVRMLGDYSSSLASLGAGQSLGVAEYLFDQHTLVSRS
uniref:Ferritin n=1 Tax=Callorhinchus milii TaxID=7868 RepID=K4FYM1_CALMI|nr:ferritin heavy chain B [Callorhinchus milii]